MVHRIRKKDMIPFWNQLNQKGLDLTVYNPNYREEYFRMKYN